MCGLVSSCAVIGGLGDLEKVDCVAEPCDGSKTGANAADSGEVPQSAEAGDVKDASRVTDSPGTADGARDSCSAMSVDASAGVFVASNGRDVDFGVGSSEAGVACGATPQAPCKSINAGISVARTLGRTIVYVAKGVYVEQVSLAAQISVRGGWQVAGGSWSFSCGSHPESSVVIEAPANANKTILADNLGGSAILSTVTVRSKVTAAPSESLYGVYATGASTDLVLDNVVIEVAKGGDGVTGTQGAVGDGPVSAGTCPPGDGLSGTPAGRSGEGAPPGTFSAAGYLPGTGGTGSPGEQGHAGAAAPAPTPIAYKTCSLVGTCAEVALMCTGSVGVHGCGGGGGLGGEGAQGGGSSVALFVARARVAVQGGAYSASKGGAGGQGGPGGIGASGAVGTPGLSTTCADARVCIVYCIAQANVVAPGSTGGTGGSGSNGGSGGAGSGGSSYAVLVGDFGDVRYLGSPMLLAGAAGTSPGNGASGAAAPTGTF